MVGASMPPTTERYYGGSSTTWIAWQEISRYSVCLPSLLTSNASTLTIMFCERGIPRRVLCELLAMNSRMYTRQLTLMSSTDMPKLKRTTPRPWLPKRKPFEGYRHHNTEFYQSTPWRKLRALKLEQEPMCEECLKAGRLNPAQMVDHIVPINKGGASLDIENLQSLCNACHARKSAKDK